MCGDSANLLLSHGKVSILAEAGGERNSLSVVALNSAARTLACCLGSRCSSRKELARGCVGSILGGGVAQQVALGKSMCADGAEITALPPCQENTWTASEF